MTKDKKKEKDTDTAINDMVEGMQDYDGPGKRDIEIVDTRECTNCFYHDDTDGECYNHSNIDCYEDPVPEGEVRLGLWKSRQYTRKGETCKCGDETATVYYCIGCDEIVGSPNSPAQGPRNQISICDRQNNGPPRCPKCECVLRPLSDDHGYCENCLEKVYFDKGYVPIKKAKQGTQEEKVECGTCGWESPPLCTHPKFGTCKDYAYWKPKTPTDSGDSSSFIGEQGDGKCPQCGEEDWYYNHDEDDECMCCGHVLDSSFVGPPKSGFPVGEGPCPKCGVEVTEDGMHIVYCVICKERVKEGQIVAPGQVMCKRCWVERGNEGPESVAVGEAQPVKKKPTEKSTEKKVTEVLKYCKGVIKNKNNEKGVLMLAGIIIDVLEQDKESTMEEDCGNCANLGDYESCGDGRRCAHYTEAEAEERAQATKDRQTSDEAHKDYDRQERIRRRAKDKRPRSKPIKEKSESKSLSEEE